MVTKLENRFNNIGRRFSPLDEYIIDTLRSDGYEVYRRCCQIVGYEKDRLYFVHVDHSDVLYWTKDNVPITDLY